MGAPDEVARVAQSPMQQRDEGKLAADTITDGAECCLLSERINHSVQPQQAMHGRTEDCVAHR